MIELRLMTVKLALWWGALFELAMYPADETFG